LDELQGFNSGTESLDGFGGDNSDPTVFQPREEMQASKILRESQAKTSSQCPELRILLYCIQNEWRMPPETDVLEWDKVK
jgi:hypothetical protein